MTDPATLRTQKERLRHEMRARRRALGKDAVEARSQSICAQIEGLPEFQKAECVAFYIPFDKEVDTMPLFQKHRNAKRFVATRITPENLLELREIHSTDDLELGGFGVLEAKESCPLVNQEAIDLFLIPGIAFDHAGNRLGFGAGHFDRLLGETSGYRVGLAYRFQIVEQLPKEPHDIHMHRVISED